MATLTKSNINDIGTIVRQAITDLVPKIITQQVPGIIQDLVPDIIDRSVPAIVRRETAILAEDIKLIKLVQGNQSITLRTMQADISQLRQLAREQGIMYEDLYHDFLATSELLSENLTVKTQITDHESRLSTLETTRFINNID